ncbi:MAG: phosphoenolpyruvate synthase [Desulfohalobiaceae bacterium]
MSTPVFCRWLQEISKEHLSEVGEKNALQGDIIQNLQQQKIRVPEGFATTAHAYWQVIYANQLDQVISGLLQELAQGRKTLQETGQEIRNKIMDLVWPEEVSSQIIKAYHQLCNRYQMGSVDVAVRSSAIALDQPEAYFVGQQEAFLNICGEHQLLEAIRKCFASLFTDLAINYRQEKGIDHFRVALSVGVQKMVRSDLAGSGIMSSMDTQSGFPHTVIINAAWGLGINVVQGKVSPDEYWVFKPLLQDASYRPILEKSIGTKEKKLVYALGGTRTIKNVTTPTEEKQAVVLRDEDILQLAVWAQAIERYYQQPMYMEWAQDGQSQEIFIVQARAKELPSKTESGFLQHYTLKNQGEPLLSGLSIGDGIASGQVCRILSAADMYKFQPGSILVTEMTDPDWVQIMKKAAGIVTNQGSRTCHTAIVSRELGIPAIVGTGSGTQILQDGEQITISCAEGEEGTVYPGILDYEITEIDLQDIPRTSTQIMINIASPAAAYRWWRLPCQGIGLARMEFIINNEIKIHPMALIRFDQLQDRKSRGNIQMLTYRYKDKTEYFVDHLALGIAKIAASQYPEQVIVRMSDFKSNEYANLIGGQAFESQESNPMLGFRGASRYYSQEYLEGFALECQAIKRVRDEIGLNNVVIMIPFCRSLQEADKVLEVLAKNGLPQGENSLEVYLMCEIPSNIVLAEEFAMRFDGFSIGSNDLTQLILGVDRDSAQLRHLFNEQDEAVKRSIKDLLRRLKSKAPYCKVGICGQAPSDYPEFAAFLVREGIDSISLNPDSVLQVKRKIAEVEAEINEKHQLLKAKQ